MFRIRKRPDIHKCSTLDPEVGNKAVERDVMKFVFALLPVCVLRFLAMNVHIRLSQLAWWLGIAPLRASSAAPKLGHRSGSLSQLRKFQARVLTSHRRLDDGLHGAHESLHFLCCANGAMLAP